MGIKKRYIKFGIGIIIFLTLPTVLFYGFVYFRYHEDLPVGSNPDQADLLAQKMLDALDYNAYQNTDYIEWMYKKRRFYKWKKNRQTCTVQWKDFKVELNLNDNTQSQAYIHNFNAEGEIGRELIEKAVKFYKNDSFWLIAPYTVFDESATRKMAIVDGKQGLLVTYPANSKFPEGSYFWHLNDSGRPTSLQLWVPSLPIDGLEMTWNDWTTTESGAQLATFHELLFFGFRNEDVKGTN